jgi:hypothetical protein
MLEATEIVAVSVYPRNTLCATLIFFIQLKMKVRRCNVLPCYAMQRQAELHLITSFATEAESWLFDGFGLTKTLCYYQAELLKINPILTRLID